MLALGVLTACSGLGSVNTGTDAEKAAELAQQLRVAYAPELDNTAKAVAEWFVQEPDSLRVSGLGQHRTSATIRIIQQVPNKNCG